MAGHTHLLLELVELAHNVVLAVRVRHACCVGVLGHEPLGVSAVSVTGQRGCGEHSLVGTPRVAERVLELHDRGDVCRGPFGAGVSGRSAKVDVGLGKREKRGGEGERWRGALGVSM